MSDDPLTRRMSEFTPDGSSLDRDALLFAAGRASARPNRGWMALAGALAASQLLTLGMFFWPRHTPPAPGPVINPPPIMAVEPSRRPAPERSMWTLRDRLIEAEGNLPASPASEEFTPSEGGLRAFGPIPPELLN